jgi:hypothetical protein
MSKPTEALAPLSPEQLQQVAVILRRNHEWVKMGLERPRWRDFLWEVERQLGRPVTEQAMRVHCINTLRCMPRDVFRYVGF